MYKLIIRLQSIIAVLLFLSAGTVQAVEVKASVDKEQTWVGRPVIYTLRVTGIQGGNAPRLPDIPGVSVRGPSTSSEMSIVNGSMSASVAFQYELFPGNEGQFVIPSFALEVKGEKFTIRSFTVSVGPASNAPSRAAPQRSADPFDQLMRRQSSPVRLFLRAVPDRPLGYVNQEFGITYKLYMDSRVRWQGQRIPRHLEGFWAEEIDLPGAGQAEGQENVEGITYLVFPVYRELLFPLTPGKKTLPPMEAVIDLAVSFFNTDRKKVSSAPVGLEVRPLPEGRPEGFSGAVGQYSISAEPDRSSIKQNEAVSLRITIKGKGNIKTVSEPVTPELDNFRVYQSSSSVNKETVNGHMHGAKVFEYILSPVRSGNLRIPPFRFSYFDPVQARYRTVSTSPVTVNVRSAPAGEQSEVRLPDSREMEILGRDIRFIHRINEKMRTRFLYETPLFYIIIFLDFFAVIAGFFIYYSRKRVSSDEVRVRKSRAYRLFRKNSDFLLKRAENNQINSEGVLSSLEPLVLNYAADKLSLTRSGLILDDLDGLLRKKDLPHELVVRYRALVEELRMLKYAPHSLDGLESSKKVLKDSRRIIEEIEGTKLI